MSTSKADFKNTYFQHPSLTPVRGEPTYEALLKLHQELKANANAVPTTLGGGRHGHLGLVVKPTTYARIAPQTPFIRPENPGVLNIEHNATQYQIAQQKDEHNKALKAFNECNLLERTLIQQIKEAIENDYMEGYVDEDTGLVRGTVPEIMKYLFETYGHISPTTLNEKREEILNMTYDPNKPIDLLFNKISKYATVADVAGSPETPSQLVNIAPIILAKPGIFSHDIRTWHSKNENDKNWPSCKTHFKDAQKLLRMTGGTVSDLGLHGANAMVEQIIQGIREQAITDQHYDQDNMADHQMTAQMDHMANVAAQNAALVDKVNQMMEKMKELQSQIQPGRQKTPGEGKRQPKKKQYCWSHGSCAHSGKDCRMKREGHKDEATFTNLLGGSTKNCYWL